MNRRKGRENRSKDDMTVNAMFDSVDVDGSGRISFRQFRKGRTGGMTFSQCHFVSHSLHPVLLRVLLVQACPLTATLVRVTLRL